MTKMFSLTSYNFLKFKGKYKMNTGIKWISQIEKEKGIVKANFTGMLSWKLTHFMKMIFYQIECFSENQCNEKGYVKTHLKSPANLQPVIKDPPAAMIQNTIWVSCKRKFWFLLHEHIPSNPVTIIHIPAAIGNPVSSAK